MMLIKSHVDKSIRGSIPNFAKVKDYLNATEQQFVTSDKAITSTIRSQLSSMKFDGSKDGSVESGWTVYLENSSSYFSRRIDDSFDVHKDVEDEEEVDLSMVSDASSGPQIFRENEVVFPENDSGPPCFCAKTVGSFQKSGRKIKGGDDRRQHRDRQEQTTSFLDDTATSDPNFNFNNSESSTYKNQFNTMRQSSLSGNQRQKNQWFKGKRSGLR
ncbi:unnamed protein product [Citrullus colocynthis]|uniref:Uncharacterized protein n=1 Tax=Citrullus colocynthis TaxID=252529 RepID=A0ABP0Y5H2_9ROSI